MATTAPHANNKLVKYQKQIYREFIRENKFSPYYGRDINAIFRHIYEMKKGGDQINVPLVERLENAGVSTGTLVGAEEAIDNYGFRLWLDWARNAVTTNKRDQHNDSADVFGEAKPLLSNWGKELQRDEMILALHAIPNASAPTGLGGTAGNRVNGIKYSAATDGEKDTWTVNNADRVLFGNAVANYSTTHATALGNITAAMQLSPASLSLSKRMAMNANPKIRPYMTKDGYEYFVWFVNSLQFRDLKADSTIIAARTSAMPRSKENPLFQDGDIYWDGMIVREIPEMGGLTTVADAGAESADVAPAFMCGKQAAAVVWGKEPVPTFRKEDDYGFIKGAGIEMAYGIGKIAKVSKTGSLLKDWGVFTHYTASVADA